MPPSQPGTSTSAGHSPDPSRSSATSPATSAGSPSPTAAWSATTATPSPSAIATAEDGNRVKTAKLDGPSLLPPLPEPRPATRLRPHPPLRHAQQPRPKTPARAVPRTPRRRAAPARSHRPGNRASPPSPHLRRRSRAVPEVQARPPRRPRSWRATRLPSTPSSPASAEGPVSARPQLRESAGRSVPALPTPECASRPCLPAVFAHLLRPARLRRPPPTAPQPPSAPSGPSPGPDIHHRQGSNNPFRLVPRLSPTRASAAGSLAGRSLLRSRPRKPCCLLGGSFLYRVSCAPAPRRWSHAASSRSTDTRTCPASTGWPRFGERLGRQAHDRAASSACPARSASTASLPYVRPRSNATVESPKRPLSGPTLVSRSTC